MTLANTNSLLALTRSIRAFPAVVLGKPSWVLTQEKCRPIEISKARVAFSTDLENSFENQNYFYK